jgi:hypothetical protein
MQRRAGKAHLSHGVLGPAAKWRRSVVPTWNSSHGPLILPMLRLKNSMGIGCWVKDCHDRCRPSVRIRSQYPETEHPRKACRVLLSSKSLIERCICSQPFGTSIATPCQPWSATSFTRSGNAGRCSAPDHCEVLDDRVPVPGFTLRLANAVQE